LPSPVAIPLEAVVFDLDGTLIDSAADLCAALNQALGPMGRRPLVVAEVKAMVGDGVIRLTERALAATGEPLAGAALDEAIGAVRKSYAMMPTPVLYKGARELLAGLANRGLVLALCTNKMVDATLRVLDQLELAGRFKAVAGGDSYPMKKPDPMPVLALLSQLGVAPDAAVMVGDSINDITAGRAAGVMTVAVSYGYSTIAPRELGADCLIDQLDEIESVLAPRLPKP